MYKNTLTKKIVAFTSSITLVLGFSLISANVAYAAALTALSDTMSSVKIAALSNHDIRYTAGTTLTFGQTVVVTFPGTFSIAGGLTFTDVDLLVNGSQQTLAAAGGASTWGVVRTSATVLTLTAPSSGTALPSAGQTMQIRIGTNATNQSTGVNQITNDGTTGTKVITLASGPSDTGSISVQLITDDTVAVSATVQQAISFSISTSTIYFGTLASGAAKYASSTNTSGDAAENIAHTLAVSTNAPSGYTITVQGQTLTSQQNSANTIDFIGASPAASAAGTEQFGIRATKAGGSNGTIAAPYVNASNYGYNATATSSATFASGSSSTNTETYSLRYLANIAGTTEAGTYAASLNYVATANF